MRLWRGKRQEEEPVTEAPEPTDPILDDGSEKVVLINGEEVLLDQCKVVHIVEGRSIRGNVIDPTTLKTTAEIRLIDMRAVARHVAMGFRNSDRSLHETNLTPRSLR